MQVLNIAEKWQKFDVLRKEIQYCMSQIVNKKPNSLNTVGTFDQCERLESCPKSTMESNMEKVWIGDVGTSG